jgi:STE24 endopeptidase
MQFLLIAAFVIGLVLPVRLTPPLPLTGTAALAAAAAIPLLMFLVARLGPLLLRRRPPRSFGLFLHVLLLALYAADVLGLGLHRHVHGGLGLAGVVLAPKLAVLAPYLAGLYAVWIAVWRFDRGRMPRAIPASLPGEPPDQGPPQALRWTLPRYLAFRSRQHLLLFFVPMLLAFGLIDLIHLWRDHAGSSGYRDLLFSPIAAVLPVGLVLLVLGPEVIRRVLPTRRLREGPLRRRLEALAARVGFRCRDILVWRSDSAVVNALIMGIVPRFRYVLLSDGLLLGLPQRAVEAVFAHEVGHARRYHLVFLFAALMGTGLAGAYALEPLLTHVVGLLSSDTDAAEAVTAALAAVVLGGSALAVVSFLSRRFERQADLFAARSLCDPNAGCVAATGAASVMPGGVGSTAASSDASIEPAPAADAVPADAGPAEPTVPPCATAAPGALCPAAAAVMIDALTVVAGLARVSRTAPSLLHGSIAGRQEFLASLTLDPAVERRFERRLTWWKTACLLAAAAGVLVAAAADWSEAAVHF